LDATDGCSICQQCCSCGFAFAAAGGNTHGQQVRLNMPFSRLQIPINVIFDLTDFGCRYGDDALSIASNAGHFQLATALKVQVAFACDIFFMSDGEQVYSNELPRACLLSAVCQFFPPLLRQSASIRHSLSPILHHAVSQCAEGATRHRQRLLLLRCSAMTRLVAASLCRHAFAHSCGRALLAYCSSALAHQLLHHTPEIGGLLV
jgi:hypothetical protein